MSAFRFTVLLCLITVNYVLFAQENTRPTVAILEFEGQGISLQEVQTLTERMRTEIGNTNAIRLIERKQLKVLWRSRAWPSLAVYRTNARRKWDSF